jgi:hypothetical protein
MGAQAVLALQRQAGNAAVSALVARQVVARDPDVKTAPPRPLPDGFEWVGSAQAPKLIVSRAWLETMVSRGTTDVTGDKYPEVLRPIIVKLLTFYPWAQPRQAEILGRIGSLRLQITKVAWEAEQFEIPMDRTVFQTIGQLPPDAPIQVYRVGSGLEIYVDTKGLGATGDVKPEELKGAATRVASQVEETVKLPMLAIVRPVVERWTAERLAGAPRLEVLRIDEETLRKIFGEKEWGDYLAESESEDPERGAVLTVAGGASFRLAPNLTEEDRKFVEQTMKQLLGESKGGGAGQHPLTIYPSDVKTLRELTADPKRLKRLKAMLKRAGKAGGGKAEYLSFADMVETLGEAAEMEEVAEQLKIKLGSGERDEEPIDHRPVRGEIINKTGALVPEQEGRFEFMTHDNVDAFRVPMVKIKWYAVDKDGKTVDDEPTRYIEVRPDGILNDRVFEVTFKKTGLYKIHAFVDHNFFLPAHFTLPIEVRTEPERLSDLDRRAGFGTAKGGWQPHRFKDVDEEDRAGQPITILGPAPIPLPRGKDYAAGRRSTGTIDPELLAVEGGSVEMGIRVIGGEIEELEKLRKDVEARGGSDKADMLEWIDERLGRLKETRDKFTGARKDKDAHPVHCQGSYVARTNRAPGGPLTLVSWFTVNPLTGEYDGHLMDHSELLKAETYHFKASDKNYERMMERLFFELSKTYPDGSMTFAFQVYKDLEPTGDYVRFERVTDTATNDARDFWTSDEANLAINILAALLSVFPPTMALGITIGLVYNTAQALDAYAEAERTGTLRAEHKVGLALAALDIIPVVGKSGKLVRLGARTYRVIDAAQFAGQAYLMATTATGEVENIRDQKLSRLAKLGEEIKRLKRTNASDPQLRALEDEAEKLRQDIRNASKDVFTTMSGSFLLQMAPIAAINAYAARGGVGGGDVPDRPGADRPPTTPDTPPGAPDTPPKRVDPPSPVDTPGTPRPTVAKDAGLAEGLPDHVRRDVTVLRDESIHDNTVRVEYTMKDGLVTEVSIRAGRAATRADIQLHAQTASLMLGYRGISGRIRVALERYKAFIVGGGTPPPVGSRAWEAKLEIDKLPRIIRDRMQKLEAGVDAATAARLQSEVEYLTGQLDRHTQTFERMELEAGRGHVAAEGEHHQRAVKDGYPSLDDAPGHYYEPSPGGGYELRQRADSSDRPFKLVKEDGRWVLQKGEHKPLPGLDLPAPALRRVLDVMTGEQAQALAQWIGPRAFAELAGAKTPDGLQRALRAHERVLPLLSDPEVVKGLDRLIGAKGAKSTPMGIESRLDALDGVPDANLRDFLIWVGREEWQHPHGMGVGRLTKVGAATDELRFMVRYGREVYNEVKAPRDVFEKLMAHLHTLDDAAADAFVKEMVAAGSTVPRERLLNMPKRPPARRSSRHGRADPKDPRWPEYVAQARAFLSATNDKGRLRKDMIDPKVDFETAVEAYATVLQVGGRVTARWEAHQNLPHAQKLRILQDLDDIGRHGGLPDTWINNARGDVAEALFAPGGGRKQISIPNPEHPAPGGGPGRTQLDGVYEPGKRPKSDSPVREWVEVKSDVIDVPGKQGRANADAVRLARGYARDGLEDWDALRANPGMKDDRIVIHFVRTPDAVTQEAMLKVLFGPDSPFAAVGFGKDWHNRPSMDNMPKGFAERQAATIPVPAGTPTPVPVGSDG